VAGLLVRELNGVRQIGTHVPTQAVRHNKPNQRTTVGGKIESSELCHQAMLRELGEEYGWHLLPHCSIYAVPVEPMVYSSSCGDYKLYFWYWIELHFPLEPVVDKAEVFSFHWDPFELAYQVIDQMGEERRKMMYRIFQEACLPLQP